MTTLKTAFLLAALLLAAAITHAQTRRAFQQNRELHRISLDEKLNLPLKNLPSALLQAYKAGTLVGYYPNAPEAKLSYNDFLVRFGLARKITAGQDDFLFCDGGANYRYNSFQNPDGFVYTTVDAELEAELTRRFSVFLDIVQDRVFDQTTSRQVYDIKLVRLVFADVDRPEFEKMGVVFRYTDIVAHREITVENPKNDAAPFSLQQVFRQRMFDSVLTMDGHRAVMSLEESKRNVERKGEFAANIWSY